MPLKLSIDGDDVDQLAAIHAPGLVPHLVAPSMGDPAGPMSAATPLAPPEQPPAPPKGQGLKVGRPTITAEEGSPGFYKEQMQQMNWDKQNPWGSPENHPGFLGKVGHVLGRIGNIAGDVLAPATTALIPGTDLNNNLQMHNAQRGFAQATERQEVAQNDESKRNLEVSQGNEADAKAEALLHPKGTLDKPENLQQSYADAVDDAVKNGRDPATDPKVQQYGDAIQRIQPDKGSSKEPNAAEAIRRQLSDELAKPAPDQKIVKNLQARIKALDPEGQQRIGISVQQHEDTRTDKQKAAQDKAAKPYQDMLDARDEAHNLAKMADAGNAEADVNLALAFFKMMKGTAGSGVRFTKQENDLIMKGRGLSGDLQAIGQRVLGEGQSFTPDQRHKIVQIIDMHGEAAQKALDRMGGGSQQSGGNSQALPSFKDWQANKKH